MRSAQRSANKRRFQAAEAEIERAEMGPKGQKLGAAEEAGKAEGYRVTRIEMRRRRARPVTSKDLVELVVRAVAEKAKEVYEATAQDELDEDIAPADLRRIITDAKKRAVRMYAKFKGDPNEMPENVEDADQMLAASGGRGRGARVAAAHARHDRDGDDEVDEHAEVLAANQDDVADFFAGFQDDADEARASVVEDVFARLAL